MPNIRKAYVQDNSNYKTRILQLLG